MGLWIDGRLFIPTFDPKALHHHHMPTRNGTKRTVEGFPTRKPLRLSFSSGGATVFFSTM